ncbi:hypothetical protein FRC12_013824 [Ceratobasidium sp. 428]|nr:hypothetical protein FRC12_013824 [Ceratobasidium sp. 428]
MDKRSGSYKHPFVACALCIMFFLSHNPPALMAPGKYNPVPFNPIAIAMAIMEFCIQSYRSGAFQSEGMTFDILRKKYINHMHNFEVWKGCVPAKDVMFVRKMLYKAALTNSGHVAFIVAPSNPNLLTPADFQNAGDNESKDEPEDEFGLPSDKPKKSLSKLKESSSKPKESSSKPSKPSKPQELLSKPSKATELLGKSNGSLSKFKPVSSKHMAASSNPAAPPDKPTTSAKTKMKPYSYSCFPIGSNCSRLLSDSCLFKKLLLLLLQAATKWHIALQNASVVTVERSPLYIATEAAVAPKPKGQGQVSVVLTTPAKLTSPAHSSPLELSPIKSSPAKSSSSKPAPSKSGQTKGTNGGPGPDSSSSSDSSSGLDLDLDSDTDSGKSKLKPKASSTTQAAVGGASKHGKSAHIAQSDNSSELSDEEDGVGALKRGGDNMDTGVGTGKGDGAKAQDKGKDKGDEDEDDEGSKKDDERDNKKGDEEKGDKEKEEAKDEGSDVEKDDEEAANPAKPVLGPTNDSSKEKSLAPQSLSAPPNPTSPAAEEKEAEAKECR